MQPSRPPSHAPHFFRNVKERRMPIDLGIRRLEKWSLVRGSARDNVGRFHSPDAHALTATGIDIARVLDRHRGIGRMQAPDVAMVQTMLTTDENFPEGPFVRHLVSSQFSNYRWRWR